MGIQSPPPTFIGSNTINFIYDNIYQLPYPLYNLNLYIFLNISMYMLCHWRSCLHVTGLWYCCVPLRVLPRRGLSFLATVIASFPPVVSSRRPSFLLMCFRLWWPVSCVPPSCSLRLRSLGYRCLYISPRSFRTRI